MLRRSRVSSTPDMNRLSQGVSRPGIDPRIWCSHAYAMEEAEFDEKHGWFIDVQLIPTGEEITCHVPSQYAGNEFGESECTIHKDDHLFVLIPNGDPGMGSVVIARLWTETDKPPEYVKNNKKDYVRVQEKDTSWRVRMKGDDDKHVLEGKKIRLGDQDADEKLVLGSTFRDKQKTLDDSLKSKFGDLSSALDSLKNALTQLSSDISTFGSGLTFAGLLIPPAALAQKAIATVFGLQGSMHASDASTAAGNAKTAADGLKAAVSDFESAAGDNQDYLSECANVAKEGKVG